METEQKRKQPSGHLYVEGGLKWVHLQSCERRKGENRPGWGVVLAGLAVPENFEEVCDSR